MLVTAVVTTFKRPRLVRRAVGSVLAQTYEPLQILVVEDGSETGTEAWVADHGDGRVAYVRHPENRGLAAARNTGLRLAEGELVAYLDDDNEWLPTSVERRVEALRTLDDAALRRLGVVYCGVEVRVAGGTDVYAHLRPRNRGSLKEAIVRDGPATLPSACLFSKAALERVGGFDKDLPSSVDHDIWMALAAAGYEAHAVDEPLVVSYASGDGRMTTATTPRIQGVRMFLEKWSATNREWLGEAGAIARDERYFEGVIGRLAADKLVDGSLGETWEAALAVVSRSRSKARAVAALSAYVVQAAARRVLPRAVVRRLRGVARSGRP